MARVRAGVLAGFCARRFASPFQFLLRLLLSRGMEDHDLDTALIAAAFGLAAECGWRGVSVVEAARRASLPLDRVRVRFPNRGAVLLRFGVLADQSALAGSLGEGTVRERLFDLLMSRFDVLQQHREGVLALLESLRFDPLTALLLASATGRSMAWMLEAAGSSASGFTGSLRADGLLGVWLWTVRAWRQDESADLSGTMAALDRALDRAEQAAGWFARSDGASAEPSSAGFAEEAAAAPAPEETLPDGVVAEPTVIPPPPPDAPPPASPE